MQLVWFVDVCRLRAATCNTGVNAVCQFQDSKKEQANEMHPALMAAIK